MKKRATRDKEFPIDEPMLMDPKDKVPFLKNKEEWGEGEWLQEPGLEAEIHFKYREYHCYMTRSDATGSWCGYTAIPKAAKELLGDEFLEGLDVHGGVTWYAPRLPRDTEESESLFWIGFDCSHWMDIMPRMEKVMEESRKLFPALKDIDEKHKHLLEHVPKSTYKNMEFVRKEIESMVDQIESYAHSLTL